MNAFIAKLRAMEAQMKVVQDRMYLIAVKMRAVRELVPVPVPSNRTLH